MPYLPPSPGASLPVHSQGRARHRRSYSENVPPSSSTPGAHAPLGGLPRRPNGTLHTTPTGGPKFHFKNDQESQSDTDSEDDMVSRNPYPAIKLKPRLEPSFSTAGSGNIPFPSTSRYSPTKPQSPQLLTPGTDSPRPNLPRTNSTPIFLSNGKPLKSSLKSSSSSPAISPAHSPAHLRAVSAPNTPGAGPSSSASSTSTPSTPVTPHKNVHFPREEEGGLVSVRLYSRSARPASVSLPLSQAFEDTETETETDRDGTNGGYFRQPSFASAGSSSMPFPRLPARSRSQTLPSHAPTKAPTASTPVPSTATPTGEKTVRKVWELDTMKSSAIPTYSPSVYGNVHLESLTLTSSCPASSSTASPPTAQPQITLKGSLLVRNLAYEKTVALRFTLDEWETTSEVLAHYATSLPSLPRDFFKAGSGLKSIDLSAPSSSASTSSPSSFSSSSSDPSPSSGSSPTWDRFDFTIKLDDYAPSLHSRTLWLVARYAVPYVHTRAHSMDDLASFAAMMSSGATMPQSIPIGNGGRRASGGEWEHGMTRMGVVTGQGGEWWDNNGGGNYRVVFKVKEVEEFVAPPVSTPRVSTPPVLKLDTSTPTQESINAAKKIEDESSDEEGAPKTKKNELGLKHMRDGARERKNGGPFPLPITAATLGTPTITFSPATPPNNSYFPPQPPAAPSLSRPTAEQQAQMAKETADARAKTTLAHLKGLSLKNYTAPGATTTVKVSPLVVSPPPIVAPGIQRSRSASPSLEPNTSGVSGLGIGHAPGAPAERERSASTGSMPSSTSPTPSTSATGAREITPSMMNMNVGEASGVGVDILSSSPGMVMSTSPPFTSFGMGNMGRKWTAPSSTVTAANQASQDGDDRSDTSSTSSNSASDTPPLLSPLMSPVVEFSSFAFDGSSSPSTTATSPASAVSTQGTHPYQNWGMNMMRLGGMFGGFPATIVNDPQSGDLTMNDIEVGFGEPYDYTQQEEKKPQHQHIGRRRDPPPQQQDSNPHWPWVARKDEDEDKEEQTADSLPEPTPTSNTSTITPGKEDVPAQAPQLSFRPRQPSPQPHPAAAALSKPRRPHSPLSNPALNRAAVKKSGGLSSNSRESSLESIPELAAKASGARARALPPHITNRPYTSSPLQSPLNSPLNSPRHSPRNSPRASPRPSPPTSPAHPEMQLPTSPATADSAYQAFVKKWCFAQGPTSVGGVRG